MKKFTAILILILCVFTISGCSEENETLPVSGESTANEEQTSPNPIDEEVEETEEPKEPEEERVFHAEPSWEEFIENESYFDFEKEFSFDTGSELLYAIVDLNDDGREELLLSADEGVGGFNYSWIFAFDDNGNAKLVREFYGYGNYRFNESTNVIYGPATFKPFQYAGEALFYTFDGEQINDEYSIVNDMGTFYYVEGETMKEITVEERDNYYEGFNEIELQKIQ